MTGTRPRILVFGYNAWDVTLPVARWPEPDTKCEVAVIREGGGGPGATAAVALARLGCEVRLVTTFGDDRAAAAQRSELEAAGVDLGACRTAAGHASPRAVILVDPARERRTIFWSRGDLPAWPADAVDPAWLEGVDLLYCDGHDAPAAAVLAGAARARGLGVVVDAGSVRTGTADLVAAATDVIGAAGFAAALTGVPDRAAGLGALRERGPERVGETCGADGVVALDAAGPLEIPAFLVPVVDTTGAGDAFHAGYAWARVRGESFRDALEAGAAVAALKCRDWGGRAALPTATEVAGLRENGVRRPGPCREP
ncbi:sugar kinase [bacterium]|nr:sugar kinase [bacterium]